MKNLIFQKSDFDAAPHIYHAVMTTVYMHAHAILISTCMLRLLFPEHVSVFGGANLAGVQTAVTQMTGSPHYRSGIPRSVGI